MKKITSNFIKDLLYFILPHHRLPQKVQITETIIL